MKEIIEIRKKNADYLINGTFVDTDGFTVDHPAMRCKGYRAADGSLGVACWNTAEEAVTFTLSSEAGNSQTVTLEANSVGFYRV